MRARSFGWFLLVALACLALIANRQAVAAASPAEGDGPVHLCVGALAVELGDDQQRLEERPAPGWPGSRAYRRCTPGWLAGGLEEPLVAATGAGPGSGAVLWRVTHDAARAMSRLVTAMSRDGWAPLVAGVPSSRSASGAEAGWFVAGAARLIAVSVPARGGGSYVFLGAVDQPTRR